MKIRIKFWVISSLICFTCFKANAQPCGIKISDMVAQYFPESADPSSATANTFIRVAFKMDKPQDASGIYVLFGTKKDTSDVDSRNFTIQEGNGKYFLQTDVSTFQLLDYVERYDTTGGVKNIVPGYVVEFVTRMSNDKMTTWSNLTLYIQDKNGQNSTSIYQPK